MTEIHSFITIGLMACAVVVTRALPFLLFPSKDRTPHFIIFLGKYLASAVFGMLVVYCIKDVDFLQSASHGIPNIIAITACILLHLWQRNMLLTIAGGTVIYMILVQSIF